MGAHHQGVGGADRVSADRASGMIRPAVPHRSRTLNQLCYRRDGQGESSPALMARPANRDRLCRDQAPAIIVVLDRQLLFEVTQYRP
jgi:hypothetical protein